MSTFLQAFKNKGAITIPPIQREYVQPLDKNIINGFVETLLKSFSDDIHKDLNYLYGVNKKEGFEPIDGQQRLTTLWLVYLYVAARNDVPLEIRLEYKTRDFAADFCNQLFENSLTWIKHSGEISSYIVDSPWFIASWLENVTVNSILKALDVIDSRFASLNCNPQILWEKMSQEESPVTFAFKDTEDLGDDIYVKMNARGKSLTDFENLKSWLDDRLRNLVRLNRNSTISPSFGYGEMNLDENFLDSWRNLMDNEWTDLFWKNRNRNDVYPEEIDDEQMRLFYSIAYFIWAAKSPKDRKHILKEDIDIKDIISLLEDNEKKLDKDESYLLGRMRKSTVDLPLYVLDKTNIFDEDFFISAYRILNGLIKYNGTINADIAANSEEEEYEKIYFWSMGKDQKYPISFICQLLMSEKNEEVDYRKLTLGAALCLYVANNSNEAALIEWMRFARNLLYNIRIDEENIHNVLKALNKWAKECKFNNMDSVINKITEELAIDSLQISEEKSKAKLINESSNKVKNAIFKLENHRFFLGRIIYLLKISGAYEISRQFSAEEEEKFLFYAEMLEKLFNENGPEFSFNEHQYLMHRVLLALSGSHGYGYWYKRSWCLLESKDEWKKYYLEDFEIDEQDNMPHNIGLKNLIEHFESSDQITEMRLKEILAQKKPAINDWRKELVAHPGLWQYMGSLCLKWGGNYNVVLIPGVVLQDAGRRSELRTRALYLDLKYGIFKEHKDNSDQGEYKPFGWSLRYWDKNEGGNKEKNSCLYFEKQIGKHTIAIDVYFNTNEASKRSTENAYVIEIFSRNPNNMYSSEELSSMNELLIEALNDDVKSEVKKDNEEGRLFLKNLSKQRTIYLLKESILANL